MVQASAVGKNARFYIYKKNPEPPAWTLRAAWHLFQPEVLSGEMCKCLKRERLAALTRGEPAEGRGNLDGVLRPTGRAQVGNHCTGRDGSSVALS